MNVEWAFQIIFFIGCGYILRNSDCLAVSALYVQNNALFTCVISPYTGSQSWFIDSVSVADCGAIFCSETPSNPARYSFTTDVASGMFTFRIDPIEDTDEGKEILCFDGTNTQKLTISTGGSSSSSGDGNNIGEIAGGSAGGFTVGCICLACGAIVFGLRRKRKREREFYLLNVGKSSIRVRWKMCKKDRSAIYYKLVCSEINRHNKISVTPYDNKMNFIPEFQITGLELSTSYKLNLTCYVKSEIPGTYGNVYKKYRTINVTTCGQRQSDQKREFHTLNVGQKSIKVCWPTIKENMEDPKQEYILIYSEKGIDKSFSFDNNGKEMMRHIITDLKPSTSYKINLQVACHVDSKNVIKKFEQLDVKTYGIIAAPEIEFYEINVGQTSIRVRWKLCKDGESPKKYHLTCTNGKTIPPLEEERNGDFMEYTISGLTKSTKYHLGLKCCEETNEPGESWAGQSGGVLKTYKPLDVETFDNEDDQLEEIHLLNLGQTCMKVRWKVCEEGTTPKKYALKYFGNGIERTRLFGNENKQFMRFTITNLTPSTLYTLGLRCSDVSNVYNTFEKKTYGNSDHQHAHDKEFVVRKVDKTSIRVRWKLFKEGDSNKTYKLTWNDGNGSYLWKDDKMDNFKEYPIIDLQTSTLYQLKLTCSEEAGGSDVSDHDESDEFVKKYESLDVRTNDPVDTELYTSGTTETSMKVHWTKYNNDHTNKYILSYIKDGKTKEVKIDAECAEYLVQGLQPSTLYEHNLRCCDKSYNLLKVYKPLYERTRGTSAAPKEEFYEIHVDHTSIRVRWKVYKHRKSSEMYYLTCNENRHIGPLEEDGIKEFMEYTISDLTQSTMYDITLHCSDDKNKKNNTYGHLYVVTLERARNDEFSTLEVTATSIEVRWEICKSDTPKKKYLLSYFENGSTYEECIYGKGGNLCLEYTFIGLTPSALHELNLRCLDESNKLLKVYKTLYKRTYDSPHETEFWTSEVSAQTIKVHWKECNGGPPIKKYVLSYVEDDKTFDHQLADKRNKGIQNDKLDQLKPSTLYELILRCTDESNKLLKFYKPIYKRTKGGDDAKVDATFDYPETAGIDEFYTCTVTHKCIKVSWKKYNCEDCSKVKYVLSYFENGETIYPTHTERKSKKKSNKDSSFSISGLQPSTLYEFNLRCFDSENKNKLLKVYQPLYKRTNAREPAYRVESEIAT